MRSAAEQSAWLTELGERIAEEKRMRNTLVPWFGRTTGNLPPRLVLKECPDEEL
jgi:hypothetical protein